MSPPESAPGPDLPPWPRDDPAQVPETPPAPPPGASLPFLAPSPREVEQSPALPRLPTPLPPSRQTGRRRLAPFLLRGLDRQPARPTGRRLYLAGALMVLPLLLGLGMSGGLVGGYLYVANKWFPPDATVAGLQFETTKIYSREGVLLYEIVDPRAGFRTHVTLQEIPRSLIEATIATEDASFYSNTGIDLRGIARAVYVNLAGERREGASTITQQLVRNVLLEQERYDISLERKVKEAVLALEFSRRYDKDQILEMYFNEVYYGNLAYGVEAAAEVYFGKQAKDLDLAQASMLAGLPQAPSRYDPTKNFDAAKARQRHVLDLMVRQRYLTADEADAAYAEELQFKPQDTPLRAPHFVRYVQQVLEDEFGPDLAYRGGLSVFTTVDLTYTEMVEQVARQQIDKLRGKNVNNAAVVVLNNRTGEVLAMLGSVDYNDPSIDGQVNVAVSPRQPGSSFKPLAYATAFKKGYTPSTMVVDAETRFGSEQASLAFVPKNYDERFHGPVSVRTALANSLNIPAVKVLQFAGIADTIQTAHEMGITDLQQSVDTYGLALVLGAGEVKLLDMTGAYATFANQGSFVKPTPFLRVLDRNGKVLRELNPAEVPSKPVLSPQISYLITDILSDNKARTPMFGPNSPLKTSQPAAVKTGTTDSFMDNWTVGYTPYVTVGVWVGNSRPSPMRGVSGVDGAAPIWHDVIEQIFKRGDLREVLKGEGRDLPRDFVPPEGIVKAQVCAVSGKLPTAYVPSTITDIFAEGTVPKEKCDIHGVAYNRLPKDYVDFLRDYGRQAGKYLLLNPYALSGWSAPARPAQPTPTPRATGPVFQPQWPTPTPGAPAKPSGSVTPAPPPAASPPAKPAAQPTPAPPAATAPPSRPPAAPPKDQPPAKPAPKS